MNFNNFTIKSQEAIQQAQLLAQSYGHQQIENEHILKAMLEVDENVSPFLLKKLNVMDTTAFTLCQENDLPIIVFNMNQAGNLRKLVKGEDIGTVVRG